MKPPPFDYHAPTTLDEAVRLRAELGSDASILAGGQSLVPMLNMRLARPSALIDLNRVPELAYVRRDDGGIAVGAMTRQRELERSDEAHAACPLVREALQFVAHAIVRNRGTVGGSIAHADPAAELPSVLVALGGRVTARSAGGVREIPAEQLFEFHFTTSLAPDEILTEVWLPELPPGSGHAFLELSRRHGDYALAGLACVVRGGHVRMAFTGVGPTPILVESDDPEAAAAAVHPADDLHGTAEYRRELVRVLARRAVALSRRRAAGDSV
jgi:aerobic carbon-monoxide dehydrogenase medium subunit